MNKLFVDRLIRYSHFPRTTAPPKFLESVVNVFESASSEIGTTGRDKGLTSNEVLNCLRSSLQRLGFEVEKDGTAVGIIDRPVFYGENGQPSLRYHVDAYHQEWSCGLEIEAGRAFMGNAMYRDLVQAMVMVGLEHLVVAVPNEYKFKSGGRSTVSRDYQSAVSLADAIFGHSRVVMPYSLMVIGY